MSAFETDFQWKTRNGTESSLGKKNDALQTLYGPGHAKIIAYAYNKGTDSLRIRAV